MVVWQRLAFTRRGVRKGRSWDGDGDGRGEVREGEEGAGWVSLGGLGG
jgi:hypothetical protein